MAVTTCVITGTMPADATPVSFTRTGFGTPEAAIVFMSRAYSGTNPATSAAMSVGFWDGTNQYAASIHAVDNLTVATLTSRHRYANRIAGERYWDGAAYQNLCQYTIASTTDGVTFTLTDDNTGASRYATVILFKGLTNVKLGNFAFSGTSAIDVTDVGFKPDVVFYCNPVAADAYTTNTVDNQACHLAFGVAHNDSANTITQHCVTFWSGNNASDTLVNTSTNDNCIGRRWYDDVSNFTEIISAFDANGFTVTPGSSTSSRPFYLAMKLDDPDDAYVGIIDSKTSTGTQAYTGTGFTPQLLLLASTTETAVNQSSTSPSGALMIGATDGTAQQSLIAMDDDAAATSDANSRADTSNVLNLRFDNDTVDAVAAYSSFDSDGFTLNYSDGSASARKILAFALSAGGGGATGTLAATESGSDTAALTGDVLIDGALAATESGSDTAALTGDVIVQGALAVTESGTDTAAATGLVLVQGALAATESGSDTAALAGLVLVQGSIASVEPGADTASIAGDVLVSGALAASETGSDTAAFTGDASLGIFGSIDAAESGSDSAQVTGLVLIQGGLAVTETGSDTAAITGPAAVSGSIAATETGSDTAAVTGLVLIYGSLATTETGSDTAAVSSFRPTVPGIEYTLPEGKAHYTLPDGRAHYTIAA